MAFDEYVSDPLKPVPFIENIDIGMTREYMTDDQRFASRRPDVLTYQTDVLAEDVTVAGPLQADLFVSTTGTDADFIVKLIDVHPDDAQGSSTRTRRISGRAAIRCWCAASRSAPGSATASTGPNR